MFSLLRRCSGWLVRRLEDLFAWYGEFVAVRALIMMASCVVVTGLVLIGMIDYTTENNAFKLWIPDNSDFVKNFQWLEENSPPDIRFNSLILSSEESILTREVLLHMLNIHQKVTNLVTAESQLSWDKVCYDIPVSPGGGGDVDTGDTVPWVDWYPQPWCGIINTMMSSACFEQSILEIWGYDESSYLDITEEDILEKVNDDNLVSAVFGTPLIIKDYLGEVTTDDDGRIVGAKATFIQWFGKINTSDISEDDVSNMGTGEIVDPGSLEFEAELRDLLMEDRDSLPRGVQTFINVARAFSDIAAESITGDAFMMPIGFGIMFMYVQVMLGKFNWLEQRAMLALSGLSCIGLAIGFTYGFCSALGLFYGPMHNLIPFLMLGIGVDDMFVIIQCFDNLSAAEKNLRSEDDIPRVISLTMRRAGVAITVTSLTDFMVFAIGSTTVLPALRSFCVWCGVGILAVYFFQITLFAGSLALDCRRVLQARNGWFPFYIHKNIDVDKILNNPDSTQSVSQKIFAIIADLILSVPGVVTVLVTSAAVLGAGVWQATMLEQEFQSIWFLPPSTYLRQWFEANTKYFPGDGERVMVYIADVELHDNLDKVEQLVNTLTQAEDIIKSVDSWYPAFKNFSNTNLGTNIPAPVDKDQFSSDLTQFLFSADPDTLGLRFLPSFKYRAEAELECGSPAPPVLLSTFTFTHVKFSGRDEHIPALHKVKTIIEDCDFDGLVFPFNQVIII